MKNRYVVDIPENVNITDFMIVNLSKYSAEDIAMVSE